MTTTSLLAVQVSNPSEVSSYYKERYEEVKVSYRRLEDKVNYMLTVLALEVTVFIAVCGSATFSFTENVSLSAKGFLLFAVICFLTITISIYYLGKSWQLKRIPRMPSPADRNAHNAMLSMQYIEMHKHLTVLYSKAIDEIECIHEEKAFWVSRMFHFITASFILLLLSTTCIFIGKL